MTDQIAAETDGEIYDVLDQAMDEELAPIVKILVDSPHSYLRYARAYQRHNPNHSVYRDQIADEICRLGLFVTAGSTAATGVITSSRTSYAALAALVGSRPSNAILTDSWPSYAALLAAVCKEIGIPVAGLAWHEIEFLFINMFVRQHLLTVGTEDRPELIAAAAAAVGSAVSGAWQPLAATLVHIAYLREIMVECGRLTGALGRGKTILPARRNEPENSVIVVGNDGAPALELAAIPENIAKGWTFIKPDGRTLNKLAPFMEALQPVFSAQQLLSGKNIYSSRLPLSHSDKVGGFVGVTKGNQGMMPLHQVTAIGLSGPAIFLTAATAIAQQQQMERVEKTLDDIKAMLADVSRFQQDKRHTDLTGSISYFRQKARAVLSGELVPEVLGEIERHEAELSKIYDHLVKDLRGTTEALRAIKKETFAPSKYVKEIQNAQAVVASLYDDILLCLKARTCGFQLMSAYPGREAGKKARYEAICESICPFLPSGEATVALDRLLRDKLQTMSSYENKAIVLAGESKLFDSVGKNDNAIMSAITMPLALEAQADDSLVIDFQIDDAGQIVGVRLASADK